MRAVLLIAIWATATTAMGQGPIPAAPAPAQQTTEDPSELLFQAAEHHESSGNVRLAKRLRADASAVRLGQADQLLDEKLAELDSLQKEIEALRKATRRQQQVLLRIQVLEIDRDKLRDLGVDLDADLVQFADVMMSDSPEKRWPIQSKMYGVLTAEQDQKLAKFITLLQQRGMAKVLAEPHIVTVSGRTASFNAGGQFPVLQETSGDAVTVRYMSYGTQVDFLPECLGKDALKIELKIRLSERLPATVKLKGVSIPNLKVFELETSVACQSGETVVLSGGIQEGATPAEGENTKPKRESKNRQIVVLVRPELSEVQ